MGRRSRKNKGDAEGEERREVVEDADIDTILWTPVASTRGDKQPTARHGHTFTLTPSGRAVLVGGEDSIDEGSPYAFALDPLATPGSFEWSQLDTAGAPPPCAYHTTVLWRGGLVVAGGFNGSERARSSIDVLDLETLRWSAAAVKLPVAVSCHAAAVVGGRMLCIGGRRSDARSTDIVQSVSLTRWEAEVATTGGDGPPPLHGHTATAVGSDVFVVGGWTSDGGRRLATVYRLDARSLVWDLMRPVGESFPARSGHSAVAFGDRYILVHGGSDDYRALDDTWVLDTYDMAWREVDPVLPEGPGIEAHAMAIAEYADHARLLVLGGRAERCPQFPTGFVSLLTLGDIDSVDKGGLFPAPRRSIAERTAGIRGAGRRGSHARNGGLFSGPGSWFSSLWGGYSGDEGDRRYQYGGDHYGDTYGYGYDDDSGNASVTSASSMHEFRSGKKSASEVLGMKHSFDRRRRNSDAAVHDAQRRASRSRGRTKSKRTRRVRSRRRESRSYLSDDD